MQSVLSNRKHKASEMEERDVFTGKTFDAEKWYFIECLLDNEGKPLFKLSKPVVVVYGIENTEGNVKRVLKYAYCMVIEGGIEAQS
ncbi:hypothetical protein RhiirA4_467149 [Rhizophagus irregularis]|uniref:Uncharacterized protein n=1 Tax=Rhizophagus irregularis TaxID=588596 RepID=A0A2I1GVD0_9GLOM|nr:hypothetical protein RhiirA4_467149 [Rhizophagus irregularis]